MNGNSSPFDSLQFFLFPPFEDLLYDIPDSGTLWVTSTPPIADKKMAGRDIHRGHCFSNPNTLHCRICIGFDPPNMANSMTHAPVIA